MDLSTTVLINYVFVNIATTARVADPREARLLSAHGQPMTG